jgi:predicted RNase H-like HicB family nuclease
MARYTVSYERDEAGWWIARVHGVEGVHGNGRTIGEARRRAREALSLAIGDEAAEEAEFRDDVKLPAEINASVASYRKARAAEKKAQEQAVAEARDLSAKLVRKLGLSVRDVGDLLGLSHQRVHQLARGER